MHGVKEVWDKEEASDNNRRVFKELKSPQSSLQGKEIESLWRCPGQRIDQLLGLQVLGPSGQTPLHRVLHITSEKKAALTPDRFTALVQILWVSSGSETVCSSRRGPYLSCGRPQWCTCGMTAAEPEAVLHVHRLPPFPWCTSAGAGIRAAIHPARAGRCTAA